MSNAQIMSTKNYELFKLHPFNRKVKRTKWLEISMKNNGWLNAYPMHVARNGSRQLVIVDGHHRFEIARSLKIPVKYVVDKMLLPPEIAPTTSAWTIQDFHDGYVGEGRPSYIKVDEYSRETGIPLGLSVSLVGGESAGSNNKNQQYKHGTFKIGNQLHADQVKSVVLHMKKVGIDFATNSYFVQALSKCLWVDKINVERLIKKISTHAAHFVKQPNVDSYIDAIEDIYNRASRKRLPIAFLAKEKSKERHNSFGR